MDVEDAERFVQVTEEDYDRRVSVYLRLVEGAPHAAATEDLRDARADVLAAQQVLDLARNELRWQQVRARQRAEAAEKRVRQEAAAARRAHDDVIRIASDCIDVESTWQLQIRYRGLPDEERHQIEAHLERLSMELYQRAHPQVPSPGYPDEWWWRDD